MHLMKEPSSALSGTFSHPASPCYAGQEKAITGWAFARERSEWEKVAEGRMRAFGA
jgi:hypothetical protein